MSELNEENKVKEEEGKTLGRFNFFIYYSKQSAWHSIDKLKNDG